MKCHVPMAATTHSAPLAMVEQLQRPACVGYARGIVRGTIYAFRGGSGFGLYDKWGDEPRGLCFVGKFEYSHNNPKPGTKFGSFDKARKAAIHGQQPRVLWRGARLGASGSRQRSARSCSGRRNGA